MVDQVNSRLLVVSPPFISRQQWLSSQLSLFSVRFGSGGRSRNNQGGTFLPDPCLIFTCRWSEVCDEQTRLQLSWVQQNRSRISLLHLLFIFFWNLTSPRSALASESNSYCIICCYYRASAMLCSSERRMVKRDCRCELEAGVKERGWIDDLRGKLRMGSGRIGKRFVEFVQSLSTVYMVTKNQQKNLNWTSTLQHNAWVTFFEMG